jgi:protein phosphatase PTC6
MQASLFSHQEDFYAFSALSLNPEELRLTVKKHFSIDWDPTQVDNLVARQAIFVGIYDGHGGSAVAQYLRQELHGLFESVDKSHIPELFAWIKELGGYFKRFQGGALAPWVNGIEGSPELDLEARATQSFFEVSFRLQLRLTNPQFLSG